MTFVGRLKQHSPICRRWRGEARTGGVINSVQFTWEAGGVFRTAPLTAEQVSFLQDHDSIILEVVGTDLAPPDIVDPPAKPVAAPTARVNSVSIRPAGRR